MKRHSEARFLVIAIPEGAELSFPLAGGVSRFLAWVIDILMMAALTAGAGQMMSAIAVLGEAWRQALTLVVYFVLTTGYPMFCEWRWRGQTVGKRLFRLRVMDIEARQLTAAQITIRNLVRLVDMLPLAYLVGALSSTFSRRGQRLGDIAAGTVVVREATVVAWQIPDLTNRFNSLAQLPQLVARLRHQAPRELIQIATAALLRRDHLSPTARVELFNEVRDNFETLVTFPLTATEYLTSEQYVRNVLAAIGNQS